MTWVGNVFDAVGRFRLGHDVDAPLADSDLSRADGLQHATTPGEVSDGDSPSAPAPSPGDLPDSALFGYLAELVDSYCRRYLGSFTDSVVAVVRDRAAQFAVAEAEPYLPVREDDLTAHIHASWHAAGGDWAAVAHELLADFRITTK